MQKRNIKIAWEENKVENLYNIIGNINTPVYNKEKELLGYYSGVASIAHNGRCHGYVMLKDDPEDESNKLSIWVGGDVIKHKNGWKLIK